jgi:hypothetical protein
MRIKLAKNGRKTGKFARKDGKKNVGKSGEIAKSRRGEGVLSVCPLSLPVGSQLPGRTSQAGAALKIEFWT